MTVLNDNPDLFLRGRNPEDLSYSEKLQELIRIDWEFKPETGRDLSPVTRMDGSQFDVLWVDPNEMIREYLEHRTPADKSLRQVPGMDTTTILG